MIKNIIKAELISVGTELLRGEITDTNSAFLAAQLPLSGISVRRITIAGDILAELCQILQESLQRSDIVITTGGLGPTQDDLTREAVAALLDEKMTVDPELEKSLRAFFSRFNREMPSHNLKQAMLIPSAEALPNPRGTAPGWFVTKNGKAIVLLPGPPREMIFMWENEVLPRIKQNFPSISILTRTIKTFFIQEAKVAELAQTFFECDNPTLGIYAKPDGIQIRFLATGENAAVLLDDAEKSLTAKLEPYVWGKDEDRLDQILGRWLIAHNLTLATGEEFTGGQLCSVLSASRESDKYYSGGMVNGDKKESTPVGNEAVAQKIRTTFGTAIGLSVSGITPEGHVFISIADEHATRTWQQQYQPGRPDNRERAATAALFRLRERLIEMHLDVK